METSAPIFGFNDARAEIVREVTSRVTKKTRDALLALNDAAYHETKRLESAKSQKGRAEYGEWQRLARSLGKLDDGGRRQKLQDLCETYAWDVAGNFDPRVYKVSTRIVPPLVTAILNPRKLARMIKDPEQLLGFGVLEDKVAVEGPMDKLQRLARSGTMVYVPTHLSNMDSIVFGYALMRAGLPPATYGAGKNLFTNPILSFFMHNLGAYRVDRRIRHNLYKDVLKTYSTVLLERGYHSLFFPGGTRSRSGGVERHLKLGLVGSAMEAYARTLIAGQERRIFFVPSTINYSITLEAETLIADYLSDAGKGRYIIEDDESTRLARVAKFVTKLLEMNGSVMIRLGEPRDLFGNKVDVDGISHDARGRVVDPASYMKNAKGEFTVDGARDAQYTRELGDEICKAYLADTVAMATHVVASVAFARLRRAAPAGDLFTVLRQKDSVCVPRDELARDVAILRDELLELEKKGGIIVGRAIATASGGDIVEQAVRAFAGYHSSPALVSRPDGVLLADTNLLFYYQNRLAAHGYAWDQIAPPGVHPVRPKPAVLAVGGAT